MSKTTNGFSSEVRDHAVRLVRNVKPADPLDACDRLQHLAQPGHRPIEVVKAQVVGLREGQPCGGKWDSVAAPAESYSRILVTAWVRRRLEVVA